MSNELSKAPPRILVIDDEGPIQKFVKLILSRAHYDVTTCGSGSEGLALLNERAFNCVITDAVMPGMSGYEVVKTIRLHPDYGGIPILMLTMKRHRQDVKMAVQAGVTDYVLKPIDEQLLLDKISLCLSKTETARHTFECPLFGSEAKADLISEVEIFSLSESHLTLIVPFAMNSETLFRFKTGIFEQIGIQTPMLKWMDSEEIKNYAGTRRSRYKVHLSFMGLSEPELKKLRTWLQKESLRRRK